MGRGTTEEVTPVSHRRKGGGAPEGDPGAWRKQAEELARDIAGDQELEIIKVDENGIFRIGDSILTLVPPRGNYDRKYLQAQIDLANHLNSVGIPAAKPLTPEALEKDGLLMAKWSFVHTTEEPLNRQERSRQMGETLRAIHDYGETFQGEIPVWDTMTRTSGNGPKIVNLSEEDHQLLLDLEKDALAEIAQLEGENILIYGDFQPGNVIFTDEGTSVIDLDRICLGPREYDLAQILFFARYFDALDEEEFMKGYGKDVEVHPAWIQLRAIHSTLWSAMNPKYYDDTQRKMEHWRSGSEETPDWSDFFPNILNE